MTPRWTFSELVAEAAERVAALPAPKNGQVRAVPDERTVRYYAAIGLLDRPVAMRGRTALYGHRHLAQVIAIKRLQGASHSLAKIQALWPTLDDHTLARMTGVAIAKTPSPAPRAEFWKRPAAAPVAPAPPPSPPVPQHRAAELRLELAPNLSLVVPMPDDAPITPADVRALRAAAAPLVTELANRGLIAQVMGKLEGP